MTIFTFHSDASLYKRLTKYRAVTWLSIYTYERCSTDLSDVWCEYKTPAFMVNGNQDGDRQCSVCVWTQENTLDI